MVDVLCICSWVTWEYSPFIMWGGMTNVMCTVFSNPVLPHLEPRLFGMAHLLLEDGSVHNESLSVIGCVSWQVFVDQVTEHVVTVTRHNPVSHQSVVLVAYTAFKPPAQIKEHHIRPLKVQGHLEEIIFEMQVKGRKLG